MRVSQWIDSNKSSIKLSLTGIKRRPLKLLVQIVCEVFWFLPTQITFSQQGLKKYAEGDMRYLVFSHPIDWDF